MIRIGETHAVCTPWDCREFGVHWAKNQDATEAVKRLVEAVIRTRQNISGHYVSAEDMWLLDAALAPFTESDASLVDSGLRSCATPKNDGSTSIKGDQHG